MASGDDHSLEMDGVGDLPSIQSSGIVQFKLPVMMANETEQHIRREAAKADCSDLSEEQDRTPQDQHRSRSEEPNRKSDRSVSWDGDLEGPVDDGYHGDVGPRSYFGQGDCDRPGATPHPDAARLQINNSPAEGRFIQATSHPTNASHMHLKLTRNCDRSTRPLVKPEKFDGTEDWNTYIQHFDWCAEINGWTEQEKAQFLAVSVTGTARQVLAGVDKERLRHYGVVVQILRARFDPVGRMEFHRMQLKNRVRKSEESLSALADDIRGLVDRVFHDIPMESREKLARDCFIDALTDVEMRTRILQMRTSTLQEAMETAIELEAISNAELERGHKWVREIGCAQMVDESAKLKKMEEEVSDLKRQLAEAQAGRSVSTRRCYNCGDLSHCIKDCQKPKKPFSRDGSQGGK